MNPEIGGNNLSLESQNNSVNQITEDFNAEDYLLKFEGTEFYDQAKEEIDQALSEKMNKSGEQINNSMGELNELKKSLNISETISDIDALQMLYSEDLSNFASEIDLDMEQIIEDIHSQSDDKEEEIYDIINNLGIEGIKSYLEEYVEFDVDDFIEVNATISGLVQFNKITELVGKEDTITTAEKLFFIDELEKLPENFHMSNTTKIIELQKIIDNNIKVDKTDIKVDNTDVIVDNTDVIVDIQETNSNNEQTNSNNEQENYNNILKLQNGLSEIKLSELSVEISEKYNNLITDIKEFTNIEKPTIKDFNNLKDKLLIGEEITKEFHNFLLAVAKESPKIYRQFYDAFNENSSFKQMLQVMPHPDSLPFEDDLFPSTDEIIASATMSENAVRIGDKEYDIDGTMIDHAERPPKYYVVSENGFKLETTIARTNEIDNEKIQYINDRNKLIKNYNGIKENINSLDQQIADLPEESKEDRIRLENQKNTLLTELENIKDDMNILIDMFKRNIREFSRLHNKKLEEKEKIAQDVKGFIQQIGLDLIPQTKLNNIFSKVGNEIKLTAIDGFSSNNIDLANGIFGQQESLTSMNVMKGNIIKFFNMMISGSEKDPLQLSRFLGEFGGRIEPVKFKEMLESKGVLNDLGDLQINTVTKRLKGLDKPENTEK